MNFKDSTWLGLTSFLAFGFSIVLIGPMIPIIEKSYNVSHSYIGLALSLGSLSFLFSSLLFGLLIEKGNTYYLFKTGMIVFSLSIIIFIFMGSYKLFVLGEILLNFGGAGIEIYIPFLIGVIGKEKKAKNLNLIHSTFALGAIISPIILSLSIKYTTYWKIPLFIALFLTLIPHLFLFRLRTRIQNLHTNYLRETIPIKNIITKSLVILIMALSLYVAYEANFSSWISVFLHEAKGLPLSRATIFPSLLWLGLFLGRIIFSDLPEKFGYKRWLIMTILLSFIFLLLIIILKNTIISAFLTLILGLLFATIYPTIQAEIVERYKSNKGIALSISSATMSITSGITSYLVGYIAQIFGILSGFITILSFILFDLFFILFYKEQKSK